MQSSRVNLTSPFSTSARQQRGFTLVEVMVAIAIALALIVGISQIFGLAQQTSGAGTTMSEINSQQRSIQTTLDNDLNAMVTNSTEAPGLVIASNAVPAFRNKDDYQIGPNQTDPTVFPAPYTSAGSALSFSQTYSVNDRIHRTDRMCFFARGIYGRQTGEAPNLSSSTQSGEAYIWLGHLALPNDAQIQNWNWFTPAPNGLAGWYNPGGTSDSNGNGNNDNNLFASSWVLGRCVFPLLSDPTQANPPGSYTDSGYIAAQYPPLFLLNPTIGGSVSKTVDGTGAQAQLCSSRFDVAYFTMQQFYNYISTPGNTNIWWQNLAGLQISGSSRITNDVRYFGNPYPTRPATLKQSDISNWISAAVAQTHPIFVRGCSQFIVEFAGDYCSQNSDGSLNNVHPNVPDGQIDFIVDPNTGNRRIRWYGYYRDTAGAGTLSPDGKLDIAYDVVPVSKFAGGSYSFERSIPALPPENGSSNPFPNPANSSVPRGSDPYICAWGADVPNVAMPKMIRITVGIDNSNNRLSTQQLYEYIFTLPS